MNGKTSLRTKYPDLLPLQPDYELERLIENFDQLCNHKQPPPVLANFDVVHSFQARQAESVVMKPRGQQILSGLMRKSSLRRHRFALWQRLLFGALGFSLVLFIFVHEMRHYDGVEGVYEAKPVCKAAPYNPVVCNGKGAGYDGQPLQNITLNQKDTVNGSTVVLQKVVLTSDYTIFYLQGLEGESGYELKAGNFYEDSSNPVGSTAASPQPEIVTTIDGQTLFTINTSLINEGGEWTLIVKSRPANNNFNKAVPGVGGPWIFRFTMPSVLLVPPALPNKPADLLSPPPFYTPAQPGQPTPTMIMNTGKK